MSSHILITATSFMKSESLKAELAASTPGCVLHFVDLRDAAQVSAFSHHKDIEGWLVGGEPVSETQLALYPRLRGVSKYGVGLDNIDFEACRARGVRVMFEGGVNRLPVAEHTLGLILGLCRKIYSNARQLAEGRWNKDGGRGLFGMKVGIVGLGAIGTELARLLQLLGADIAYCDIDDRYEIEKALGIRRLDYQSLLAWAELLSFHVPLTDTTYRMFDEEALRRTQNGLILINTSRGAVIDLSVLKKGLRSGHLAGAALDVYPEEPLNDPELTALDSFLGTPHTAGNSRQAVEAMGQAAIRGVAQILFGS